MTTVASAAAITVDVGNWAWASAADTALKLTKITKREIAGKSGINS